MEKYTDIKSYISENCASDIEIKSKKIVFSLLIIIVSLAVIVISSTSVISDPNISMILIVLAIVGLVYGILRLWGDRTRHKNVFVYLPTGEVMKRYSLYVDSNDMQRVQQCIARGRYEEMTKITKLATSGHYVDVIGTPSGKCYLMQVMDYVPHQFEPVSPVAILTEQSAEIMNGLIRK